MDYIDAERIIDMAGGQCISAGSSNGGIVVWPKHRTPTAEVERAIGYLARCGWRIDYDEEIPANMGDD